MPHAHHAIDSIEFTVTNLASAKAFFSAAFGWQFTDDGPDDSGIQGDGRERRFHFTDPSGNELAVWAEG